ncbi:unnamed protein product [Vicia faba]|uniref:Uncharacterized protein n=1 Tax=Vicia faba TaxID=3906 RepID=A0AAV0YS48_VICFA|nr:unnamed protein product [Vicia faba]
MGIIFKNTDICRFKLSRNAKFEYLRERIQTRMRSGAVSQIIYRNAVNFSVNQVKYVPLKIRDDDDVETMFYNHELSGLHAIDLYIKFQLSQQSQISQVANTNEAEPVSIIPKEAVIEDDEEEETESQDDDFFTTLFEDGGRDEADAINETGQHIPLENVYCPPTHMTTLGTTGDESSFEWPQNPRLPLEDDIAVGNQFKNKSDCVFAISMYHMKHVVDFRVTWMQWSTLMQALASRLLFVSPGSVLRRRITSIISDSLADLDASMLELRSPETESAVVTSVSELHKLNARPGALEKVFSLISQIRPEIVTVVEQEANHNELAFLERIRLCRRFTSGRKSSTWRRVNFAVNGVCKQDWGSVKQLSLAHPSLLPPPSIVLNTSVEVLIILEIWQRSFRCGVSTL